MADFESRLVPFPNRPRSPLFASSLASTRQPVLAEAEMRTDIIRNLLEQIAGPDGFYPQDLRLRMTVYAAEALLDEMVVLYRRALGSSATQG
jgi:hypothetical protein